MSVRVLLTSLSAGLVSIIGLVIFQAISKIHIPVVVGVLVVMGVSLAAARGYLK